MFTGIVEKSVHVQSVQQNPMSRRIVLESDWPDVRHGESVAVNGVCLTIAELQPGRLGFDVIKETLDKTNLGQLVVGGLVHVERAMRIGDRIDGHFVQGHVDCTGKLVSQIADEKEWRLTIQPPADLMKFMAPKGSITVDGVSLTLAEVGKDTFDVALIPTTLQLTQLGNRSIGWRFNLEADVLSKTIVAYLERRGV